MAKINATPFAEFPQLIARLTGYLSDVPEHVARQAMANALGEVVRYQREGDRPEPDPWFTFMANWLKAATAEQVEQLNDYMHESGDQKEIEAWLVEHEPG